MITKGVYREDAPAEHLRFKSALLQPDPLKADNYLAQFDALHLPESHGWHSFPKSCFVNVTDLEDIE